MVENTEMNTQTAPVAETQTAEINNRPNKKRVSLGSVVIAFTLLGLLALAGVGYFLWDQLRSQQEGLGGNLDKGDKRIIELRKQINTTQTQLTTTEKQLTNITETLNNKDKQYERLLKEQSKLYEDRLKNTHAQLGVKMDHIQRQLGKTRGDWLVADAEYLLSVANERLQLTQDINTTIMALEAADHRLRESGDGGVFKVRAEIGEEISSLKKVKSTDIVGLMSQLSILQKSANTLQLSLPTINAIPPSDQETPQQVTNNKDATPLDKAVDRVLTDLKGMVIIRKRDPNTITVLQPEEARIIREDYLIRLDMAKSALARRNETEFVTSLSSAKDWLEEHFNTQTSDVKTALQTIEKLMQTRLRSQLPDISRSLKMLRDVTKFRLNADQHQSSPTSKSRQNQNNPKIITKPQHKTTGATQ
ncbi:MAG TPA: enzyme of heme biosynthesis [Crenotrichaceae bacterium]|nr:enzyme of heme biosynthesis [Crenotrichaceae bacterium]